ncbi:MAG: WG repeat-containing protein [Paracoccaceae bacterium]
MRFLFLSILTSGLSAIALFSGASAQETQSPVPECGLGPWQMCRYIDPSTRDPLTQTDFQIANPFFEGRAAVRVDGLWGFIDKAGAFVVEPQFVEVSRFRNGLAEVSNGISVSLINDRGEVVQDTDFRRAIPITSKVVMAFIDDKDRAAEWESSIRHIRPALWRAPREETVFVYSDATLFDLETGRIETPPVRSFQLIPNAPGTFWLQVADEGAGASYYDWGMMNDQGEWVLQPGIMDVIPLPSGMSVIYNPPADVERVHHDSHVGWELRSNQSGWEGVMAADGSLIGGQYFDDVGISDALTPLVSIQERWFEIDQAGEFVPFDGEPIDERFGIEQRSKPPSVRALSGPLRGDILSCADGVRLFSDPPDHPETLDAALQVRWGLKDNSGNIIAPAQHRYITCPQHGIALVPDDDRGKWCPVGPVPQLLTLANCQAGIWDGWFRSFVQPETFDADPFESHVQFKQRELLSSQFRTVVEAPKWVPNVPY